MPAALCNRPVGDGHRKRGAGAGGSQRAGSEKTGWALLLLSKLGRECREKHDVQLMEQPEALRGESSGSGMPGMAPGCWGDWGVYRMTWISGVAPGYQGDWGMYRMTGMSGVAQVVGVTGGAQDCTQWPWDVQGA